MTEESTTYVYDGREVELTGRIAVPQNKKKDVMMVEIVPLGGDRSDKSYLRWVRMDELFIVQSIEDLEE